MIVVDASVAVKWLLPERGSREAIALQTGPYTLASPSLIRMEVAGLVCRATRGSAPRLAASEANVICTRWFGMIEERILELVPHETLLRDACRLSVSFGHPLADCLYLDLARRWDIPLITADRVFFERFDGKVPKLQLLEGI